jgi:hypothetical protein
MCSDAAGSSGTWIGGLGLCSPAMPSASFLRSLPEPELVARRLRSCALLDAILSPNQRSFEFHPKWRKGEQMGAFKDGSGNFFFAWFSKKGAVIRGFDHESPMSPFRTKPPEPWPGLLGGFPTSLSYATKEPAFALEELTFCLWNTGADWQCGPVKPPRSERADPDGASELLSCLRKSLRAWANRHWDETLDREAIGVLERHEAVGAETILALNPDFDEAEVEEEAAALGWSVDVQAAVARRAERAAAVKQAAAKKTAAGKQSAPVKQSVVKKPTARSAAAGAQKRSFGQAEFTVRCEPTYVALVVHGKEVRKLEEDVYGELFDYVRARLSGK